MLNIGLFFEKYYAFTGEKIFSGMGAGMGSNTFVDPYVYSFVEGRLIKWTTLGSAIAFQDRVVWNVSANGMGLPPYPFYAASGIVVCKDIIAFLNIPVLTGPSYAYNTTNGDLLWRSIWFEDAENLFGGPAAGYGLAAWAEVPRHYTAIDLTTGDYEWDSDSTTYPWGNMWAYSTGVAYDMFYGLSYDGHIYGFDKDTGDIKMSYYVGDAPYDETPYGTYPLFHDAVIADGKIYAGTGEWGEFGTVIYREQKLVAADAITGDELWTMKGVYSLSAIAEGYLFASNAYDGYTCCFGRGPTATEVSVSESTITNGSSVWITGRVTDQSPAQPATPAVSKESMSAWLEYLHMQQPLPHDTTGVPVHLYAMTSDGSTIDVGQATSSCDGYFRYEWTPPDEDYYIISATFFGDESYYSSFAQTGIEVGPAPPAPPEPPAEEPAPDYTPLFWGVIAAVAVLIVISIVNVWALRKR